MEKLNTVEAYDHVADEWSSLPNMIERRRYHKSVAMKNKLFVVGGYTTVWGFTSEVFDSTVNKFVLLKSSASLRNSYNFTGVVVSIGTKFAMLRKASPVLLYDAEKEEWSDETCKIPNDLIFFCCTKVPELRVKG